MFKEYCCALAPRREPCRRCCSCVPVWLVPNCLPFRPPCFRLRRGILWFLLRMGFEANLPNIFPPSNPRKEPPTEFWNSTAGEMMTRSFWWCGLQGFVDEDGNQTEDEVAATF